MVRPARLLVATTAWIFISCGPCRALEQAPISKDVYWPSRGAQKSQLCDPERGPEACVFYKPRCQKGDPRCGPMPMGKYVDCYDPAAERKPAYDPEPGPSCEFDGECTVSSGCDGAYCTHYTLHPVGAQACDQQTDSVDWSAYDNLLCGCVRNRCTAYTP